MKQFKYIYLISGVILFGYFAFLQINDFKQYGNGDAWFWIFVYLLAAVMNLLPLIYKLPVQLLTFWVGFSLGSLCFRLQDNAGNFHFDRLHPSSFWDQQTSQMVQQSNESGGLLILTVWGVILLLIKGHNLKR